MQKNGACNRSALKGVKKNVYFWKKAKQICVKR